MGVACCRLARQACAYCHDLFLGEELDQAFRGDSDLYCSACIQTLQKHHHELQDAEHYGE